MAASFMLILFCKLLLFLSIECVSISEGTAESPKDYQVFEKRSHIKQGSIDLRAPPQFLAAVLLSSTGIRLRFARQLRRTYTPRSPGSQATATDAWTAAEDAELLLQGPFFTVGKRPSAVTFWSALALSNIILSSKSPYMCQERMELLYNNSRPNQKVPPDFGSQPLVLTNWKKLNSINYVGSVDGRSVWMTIESEGRLHSDPRIEPSYIVALGGRVFELGVPAVELPNVYQKARTVTDGTFEGIVNAPELFAKQLQFPQLVNFVSPMVVRRNAFKTQDKTMEHIMIPVLLGLNGFLFGAVFEQIYSV